MAALLQKAPSLKPQHFPTLRTTHSLGTIDSRLYLRVNGNGLGYDDATFVKRPRASGCSWFLLISNSVSIEDLYAKTNHFPQILVWRKSTCSLCFPAKCRLLAKGCGFFVPKWVWLGISYVGAGEVSEP